MPLTQKFAEVMERVLQRTIAPVTLATMVSNASTSETAIMFHLGIHRSAVVLPEELALAMAQTPVVNARKAGLAPTVMCQRAMELLLMLRECAQRMVNVSLQISASANLDSLVLSAIRHASATL